MLHILRSALVSERTTAKNRRLHSVNNLNGSDGCSICDHYFHHVTYCMSTKWYQEMCSACMPKKSVRFVFGGCDLLRVQRSPAHAFFFSHSNRCTAKTLSIAMKCRGRRKRTRWNKFSIHLMHAWWNTNNNKTFSVHCEKLWRANVRCGWKKKYPEQPQECQTSEMLRQRSWEWTRRKIEYW